MTCLLPSYDPMEHTNMFAKAGLDIFIIVFLFFIVFYLLTLLISVYIFQRARRAMRKMEPETSRGW